MKIMVFDTETIGKVSQDLLNVGYVIADINFETNTYTILQERDYITKLIDNEVYCINDTFVGQEKYLKMINALETKQAKKKDITKIIRTMSRDIKKFGVQYGYAYNCAFDIDKFNKVGFTFPIPVYDIWGYAHETIINTPDYIEYCKQNELLTESKQFISSKVETVVRYLSNDLTFVEEHTALSDSKNEIDILVESLKRGANILKSSPRPKRIDSGYTFHKTIILPNGDVLEGIEYKKVIERKNDVISFVK